MKCVKRNTRSEKGNEALLGANRRWQILKNVVAKQSQGEWRQDRKVRKHKENADENTKRTQTVSNYETAKICFCSKTRLGV